MTGSAGGRKAEGSGAPLRPLRLLLAVLATTLEGLALLGIAAWLLIERGRDTAQRSDIANASTAYFVVLGLLVLIVAFALWRCARWSLGAGVFLQVLALPVAWTMYQGGQWVGAAVLVFVALMGLYGLISQEIRTALGR